MKRVRSHWPLYSLLIVGLIFRLYLWKRTGVYLYGDMLRYNAMAMHVVLSGYLGLGSGPSAFVTPLYPMFLAFLYKLSMLLHGGHLLAQTRLVHEAFLAQQVLSLVTLALTYYIGAALGNRYVGFAAGVLSLLYLPNSFIGMLLLTEALFMPALFATVAAFIRAEQKGGVIWYAVAGALLGITTLVRPTVLPLWVVFLFLMWWRWMSARRRGADLPFWKPALWMTAALVVVMLPWWVRNFIDFHKFIPLSTEAGNPLLAGAIPYFRVNVDKLIQASRTLHESQQTYAIHYILYGFTHHFLYYAGWYLFGKLPYLLWQPYLYDFLPAFVLFHQVCVIVGALAALVLIVKPSARGVAFTSLYLLVVQLGFLPLARYGYPVVALWLILIPAAAYYAWNWLAKERKTRQ